MKRWPSLAVPLLLLLSCGDQNYGKPWSGLPPTAATEIAPDAGAPRSNKQDAAAATSAAPEQAFVPEEPVLARLTRAQYQNVIRDLLGPGLTVPELEPDQRLYNFASIGASRTTLSAHGVELYAQAAYALTEAALADTARRKTIVPCEPQTPLDDACLGKFLASFGRRAFRRQLSQEELSNYRTLANRIGRADPWQTLQYLTAALLQSPNFLYRVELGVPAAGKRGWRRYTGYEMASRLAFLFRNSAPDDALLSAAERGELDSADGVVNAATRLLDDKRPTENMLVELYTEYLDLSSLDQVRFPEQMNPRGTLAASMRDELIDIVTRIALRDADDMRTLFTTQRFAPNSELAPLYDVTLPDASPLTTVSLSEDSPRAGILSTGALLTLFNRPNRTSPTLRGLFVRQRLLCGTVPPPPPGIPAIKDSSEAGATIREKLEEHRANPECAGCHQSMDPIGLGMENFDQFGRARTHYDNGQQVDDGGDLDGQQFSGVRELGALLAQDPRVMSCWVKQLYRYASARLETAGEDPLLRDLQATFAANGFKLRPLLLDLVASDGFRFTGEASR